MAANVPDVMLLGSPAGTSTPAEARRAGKTKAKRPPQYFGGDELTHAELQRELEELWLAHVAPHIPQPESDSH
jgi:hypothetical protein